MMQAVFNSSATSNAIDLQPNMSLVGLHIPSGFSGTTMTFEAAAIDDSAGTFRQVMAMDGAAAYTVTITANRYVPLDPRVFAGLRRVRLVAALSNNVTINIEGRPIA